MGCGGSRARANVLEPRHQESWTRETESTWLTFTEPEMHHDTMAYKKSVPRGECGHNLLKDKAKTSDM
ncbi:hypothetical protein DNTS_025442 [Danionella cerebrum]|uniref:BAALC binder of MAP3K1 and KLF4 b n=1 Tax=Danionella cerebrum TaxID=2873325 RepID=A0A553Q361_9TELE|nr:hypothetical protein DNTS_025442 [Danionella translucida]